METETRNRLCKNPSLIARFLRLLVYESSDFKKKVEEIRNQYKIFITDKFRGSEEYFVLKANFRESNVRKNFSKKLQNYRKEFDEDLEKLCEYFCVSTFNNQMRKYVYCGILEGLHDQCGIKVSNAKITITVNFDVTKQILTERIWPEIERLQKAEGILKNINDGVVPKKYKTGEYFDTKLWLLRKMMSSNIKIPAAHLKMLSDKTADGRKQRLWKKEMKQYLSILTPPEA
ncbi:MAG: hypothetical protein PHO48_04645 [Candidatus Gracilibacteria bacterium]|nr:hypothetical protein [Candidatus Gracilibacteria bacterium]